MARLLDEMDGKQARKTGNSTPLGMLFDHGCDSFTIGFVVLMASKVLVIDDPMINFIYVFIVVFAFYAATLEEYYIGGLHLPPFNGVSDGSFVLYITFTTFWLIGNEFM